MINFDLQNHRPLREIVYEELKREILTGHIVPGTRMMEVELAEEMGVSRTPIREAIRKLEKEGLVTIEPRKGAYASSISVKDMVDTLAVRENLEGFASYLAAEMMTDEQFKQLQKTAEEYTQAINDNDTEKIIHTDEAFHRFIVSCAGNGTLLKVCETVQESALRFRYLYYDNFSRYKNMPVEHNEIMEAIASGDKERAKQLSEEHVRRLKEFVEVEGGEVFSRQLNN